MHLLNVVRACASARVSGVCVSQSKTSLCPGYGHCLELRPSCPLSSLTRAALCLVLYFLRQSVTPAEACVLPVAAW